MLFPKLPREVILPLSCFVNADYNPLNNVWHIYGRSFENNGYQFGYYLAGDCGDLPHTDMLIQMHEWLIKVAKEKTHEPKNK